MPPLTGPALTAALLLAFAGAAKTVDPAMTVGALRALGLPSSKIWVRVGAATELLVGLLAAAAGWGGGGGVARPGPPATSRPRRRRHRVGGNRRGCGGRRGRCAARRHSRCPREGLGGRRTQRAVHARALCRPPRPPEGAAPPARFLRAAFWVTGRHPGAMA